MNEYRADECESPGDLLDLCKELEDELAKTERILTLRNHVEVSYQMFRAFCDQTRPEKAPLKNYMEFILKMLIDMVEKDEEFSK